MSRCASPALPAFIRALPASGRALLLALATVMAGGSIGTALIAAPDAAAQIAPGHRFFPAKALRGTLVIGAAPEATMNGKPARLAPGARIRDANDMLAMPGQLVSQKLMVHYTRDINGLIMDVWVLNAVEAANKPWPTTDKESNTWAFSPATQRWIKS